MGVLSSAADLARIYLHSAGGGIPEWAGRTFGGAEGAASAARIDQSVADSRARAGLAGSVANIAGYVAPGGVISDAFKAIKFAPAAVRALPAVERAVAKAVVPGYAARVAGRARLGLDELPTAAEHLVEGGRNLVRNVGSGFMKHPVVYPVAGAATAVGVLGDYANQGSGAQAAAPAEAPAAAPAAGPIPNAPKFHSAQMADDFSSAMQEAMGGNGPTTYDNMLQRVMASQGGKISMHQLDTISQAQARNTPTARSMTATEEINQRMKALVEGRYQAKLQNGTPPAQAEDELMSDYSKIGRAPDPNAALMDRYNPDGTLK